MIGTGNSSCSSRPLVTDLDGTLIATDSLMEALLGLLKQRPWLIFLLPVWFSLGRLALKQQVSRRIQPDWKNMPRNQAVWDFLRKAKGSGRSLVLATATPRVWAEQLAHQEPLFDAVLATEGSINLRADRKADELLARFGPAGFDYIGNDKADFPVWRQAHTVHVVTSSAAFAERACACGVEAGRHFSVAGFSIKVLFKSLRLHQWLKNLLVLVPLGMAHVWDVAAWLHVALAFLIFGCCASGLYLLNDLVDLPDDRHHPSKRFRPLAAGQMSISLGVFLAFGLWLLSVVLAALFLPDAFMVLLLAYSLLTILYSLFLKQIVLLDVMVLASLYTLRLVGGAAAVNLPMSPWLLGFSACVFFSLALLKRYTEVLPMAAEDRVRGRGYQGAHRHLLVMLGGLSTALAMLVLALYLNSDAVIRLYGSPMLLWLLCPVFLAWMWRIWHLTHRGRMHDDPVLFAAKDGFSYGTALLVLLVLWWAV